MPTQPRSDYNVHWSNFDVRLNPKSLRGVLSLFIILMFVLVDSHFANWNDISSAAALFWKWRTGHSHQRVLQNPRAWKWVAEVLLERTSCSANYKQHNRDLQWRALRDGAVANQLLFCCRLSISWVIRFAWSNAIDFLARLWHSDRSSASPLACASFAIQIHFQARQFLYRVQPRTIYNVHQFLPLWLQLQLQLQLKQPRRHDTHTISNVI